MLLAGSEITMTSVSLTAGQTRKAITTDQMESVPPATKRAKAAQLLDLITVSNVLTHSSGPRQVHATQNARKPLTLREVFAKTVSRIV